MSSYLFRLGRRIGGNAGKVVAAWLLLLAVAGGLAAAFGGQLSDEITIPGTESQQGIDVLETRFPEVSGTIGQVVYSADEGERITEHRAAIEQRLQLMREIEEVRFAVSPFTEDARDLSISEDGEHALVQVQLTIPLEKVTPELQDEIAEAAGEPDGLRVDLGGQMYTTTSTPVSVTEAIGLAVALVVLVLTLGSLRAAAVPLLTAVVGVGVTMAAVLLVARFAPVNTSTPTLAMMIGLAVGIDYALFLAARHRDQLGEGMEVEESVARSVATAGSAVIFAGVTVVIALCGLVVAQIPFLSLMGVAAAAGVAVAVGIALTLVPAILALAGERLRPTQREPRRRRAASGARGRRTVGRRWVALATRRPAITLAVGVIGLLMLAFPGKDLALGLPDTGSAPHDAPERITYDLIAEEYGPGFNSPLLVTADIVRTREPIRVMKQIGDDIGQVDGVEAIALTTPNRKADLGIVQVVPEHGQTDPRTADLVRDIREQAPAIEDRYDVTDVLVTGQTAATIDVSERLWDALLPFGLVVVGLSLLLLSIVFRSIAVPLKATVGYLFSVGASFGAVVLVFQEGWFADVFNVEKLGPVPSFLPIMLMGVLFGLAMDYEVFLVARMREEYVHGGDAHRAIETGFVSSARVVTAAAVIMIAVFASFVPHGDSAVKPIAFGLAVGVAVDAFVVRMTLVPAVLALLGEPGLATADVARPAAPVARRRGRGPLRPPGARRLDRAARSRRRARRGRLGHRPRHRGRRARPDRPPGAPRRGAPRHRRGGRTRSRPARSAGRPDASRRRPPGRPRTLPAHRDRRRTSPGGHRPDPALAPGPPDPAGPDRDRRAHRRAARRRPAPDPRRRGGRGRGPAPRRPGTVGRARRRPVAPPGPNPRRRA